jgi:uncharacterized membrane protein
MTITKDGSLSTQTTYNQNNANNEEAKEDSYNIINIIVIVELSIIGGLILSGLTYLCYHNHLNRQEGDNLDQIITNTFNTNFRAQIGLYEYGNTMFLGENSAEYNNLNE